MKVAINSGETGLLLVSAIQKESISIYYQHLSSINFDETVDMIPAPGVSNVKNSVQSEQMPPKEAKNTDDVHMDDQGHQNVLHSPVAPKQPEVRQRNQQAR